MNPSRLLDTLTTRRTFLRQAAALAAMVKRLAPFAEKHRIRVGFHNHTANLPQGTFPANIELEHKIPAGSDAIKEVTKCVDYCRAALA